MLAERLGIRQATLAKLEARADTKLSTIASYARALDEDDVDVDVDVDVEIVVRYRDGTVDTVPVPAASDPPQS